MTDVAYNILCTQYRWLVSYISANYRIKVYSRAINRLVGVWGLVSLVGFDLCFKFLNRAYSSIDDKLTFKLRRGLKVTFYSR
ncbi:hypothetical protein SAMN05444362_102339 [Dysgonomonas macrotermitis]|uniref:Uncharacterized protein n=1 Tax=Dysgonomonas macrotermitis TaxID=1346286 RepID=A0A1M4WWQ2_9BACT|nr:hypothetical protein SAMN05444362_102339 [Dysgonomonas macrotermitis]